MWNCTPGCLNEPNYSLLREAVSELSDIEQEVLTLRAERSIKHSNSGWSFDIFANVTDGGFMTNT